jgi:uncharacterized coiled-coil protein SlyX
MNAMLLNEFLKEHRNVAEQQSTIAELKAALAKQQKQIAAQQATAALQQKQIEALTATVRRVSERVELSAFTPKIVANEDGGSQQVPLLHRCAPRWKTIHREGR